MFNQFINNTKVQFITLLSFLILSVSAVIIYLNFNLNLFNKINDFNEDLNKITVHTVNLKNSLEKFERTEHQSDFYELNTDDISDEVYDAKNLLSQVNDRLLSFRRADTYESLPLLKQNTVLLNDFETLFFQYVANKIDIGNGDHGYILELEQIGEKLELNLKMYPGVYAQFEELNKFKTIYLSSSDPDVAMKFSSGIQQLKDNIVEYKTSIADERDIISIADAMAEYQSSFDRINNLERVNGTIYFWGLFNDLTKICDELIINVSAIIDSSKIFIKEDYKRFKIRILLLIILSTGIIILTIIILYQIFTKRLFLINKRTKSLAFENSGDIPLILNEHFNQIHESLSKHDDDLNKKEMFIKKMIEKEFDADVPVAGDDDRFGKTLYELKEHLISDEKKKKIETERSFIEDKQKEGIARFGRILRRHVGNIDSLSYELISELVTYIEADIGGIYVVDRSDEQPVLKLRGSYAYNEQKMIKKEIAFGEGVVGTCAVDRSTFYFDKIDDDYIKIVSGFGSGKPESLLICPIFVEKDVYGVLELAATRKFTKNDIEFIEILAEDIAYTLSYLLSLETE